MENIHIEQTDSTPLISFAEDSSTLRIVGESYPENSFDFYAPVVAWLKLALAELKKLEVDFSVTYMNSSSTKCTLDLLDIMEEAFSKGVQTSIIWRYDSENPRSYMLAEEFREEVTFPFEIEVMSR